MELSESASSLFLTEENEPLLTSEMQSDQEFLTSSNNDDDVNLFSDKEHEDTTEIAVSSIFLLVILLYLTICIATPLANCYNYVCFKHAWTIHN